MARTDHSHNWATRLSPSLNEIDSIARNAFANLPSRFRVLCDNLVISVTDFPDDQMMDDMGLESPFELLGLFEGQGISERFSLNIGNETNRKRLVISSPMFLFRKSDAISAYPTIHWMKSKKLSYKRKSGLSVFR